MFPNLGVENVKIRVFGVVVASPSRGAARDTDRERERRTDLELGGGLLTVPSLWRLFVDILDPELMEAKKRNIIFQLSET